MSSKTITQNDLTNILNEIFPATSDDMTPAQIEDFVQSLNAVATSSVDYIVEQGVDGIWTYRKWNSGIAECWGKLDITYTGVSNFGAVKYMLVGPQALPDGLFVTGPSITATARKTQDASGMPFVSLLDPISTTQFRLYVADVGGTTQTYTYTCSIAFEVKGTWK